MKQSISIVPEKGVEISKRDMPYACQNCARRKVRCDKACPTCSTCHRFKTTCVYEAPPPPKKRKRKTEEDTQARLERYERLLRDNGLLTEDTDGSPSKFENSHVESPPVVEAQTLPVNGRLVSKDGKLRYIDSTLWTRLSTNQDDDFFAKEVVDNDATVSDDEGKASPNLLSAGFLGITTPTQELTSFYPRQDVSLAMWEVFVKRVDPITRILHLPTAKEGIHLAFAEPRGVSRPTECLVFVIYFAALTAMDESECSTLLNEPRASLLSRHHQLLQIAFTNADFLRSLDIQVLQAYVMFLLVARFRIDPQLFWILTGVAVRMAQRMGLHRDGELTGLKPFDREIHRRIFWQLPSLDGFAGQTSGTGINIDASSWDTKMPLNINDEDIWPEMKDPPTSRNGATEMIFYLAKIQSVKFYSWAIRLWPILEKAVETRNLEPIAEAERFIDQIENLLETKYLRYCDPMESLHLITSIMARTSLQCARFRIRLPLAKAGLMTEREQEQFRVLAFQVLDRMAAAHTNPVLALYRWHTSSYGVWDIVTWLVQQMQKGSLSDVETNEACMKLGILCAEDPRFATPRQTVLSITKGILNIWDTKVAQGNGSLPEPRFISNLRVQSGKRAKDKTDTSSWEIDHSSMNQIGVPGIMTHFDTGNSAGFDDGSVSNFDWTYWDQSMIEPEALNHPIL